MADWSWQWSCNLEGVQCLWFESYRWHFFCNVHLFRVPHSWTGNVQMKSSMTFIRGYRWIEREKDTFKNCREVKCLKECVLALTYTFTREKSNNKVTSTFSLILTTAQRHVVLDCHSGIYDVVTEFRVWRNVTFSSVKNLPLTCQASGYFSYFGHFVYKGLWRNKTLIWSITDRL